MSYLGQSGRGAYQRLNWLIKALFQTFLEAAVYGGGVRVLGIYSQGYQR